jgi:hypothetical protein
MQYFSFIDTPSLQRMESSQPASVPQGFKFQDDEIKRGNSQEEQEPCAIRHFLSMMRLFMTKGRGGKCWRPAPESPESPEPTSKVP